jgi:hypothetical protein
MLTKPWLAEVLRIIYHQSRSAFAALRLYVRSFVFLFVSFPRAPLRGVTRLRSFSSPYLRKSAACLAIASRDGGSLCGSDCLVFFASFVPFRGY